MRLPGVMPVLVPLDSCMGSRVGELLDDEDGACGAGSAFGGGAGFGLFFFIILFLDDHCPQMLTAKQLVFAQWLKKFSTPRKMTLNELKRHHHSPPKQMYDSSQYRKVLLKKQKSTLSGALFSISMATSMGAP